MALDATPLIGASTGVGDFCAGLLGGLVRRGGLEVAAFAVTWRRRGWLAGSLPEGVAFTQRPMPARPLHLAWRHLDHPALEWFIGPTDVVHGTNFVVPPTRRAAAVVTVHDLTTLRFPELCDASTLGFPALVSAAARRGAFVHTPSRFVAGEVTDLLGIEAARVRAVHSGIPEVPEVDERFCDEVVGRFLPEGTERYVLATATAEPRKDLPGLVEAFGQLAPGRPGLALVLAGPPGWGSAALEEAVEACGARRAIVRTGWLDEASLAALLRRAAVLAYPSRYEGFGFPPLRAMSVGVPVVTTTAGALPEVVGDAARCVAPGDRQALAEALASVLDDRSIAASLVAKGLAHARGFSWERCAEEMTALYRAASEALG